MSDGEDTATAAWVTATGLRGGEGGNGSQVFTASVLTVLRLAASSARV